MVKTNVLHLIVFGVVDKEEYFVTHFGGNVVYAALAEPDYVRVPYCRKVISMNQPLDRVVK